jgi:hypothetical protein
MRRYTWNDQQRQIPRGPMKVQKLTVAMRQQLLQRFRVARQSDPEISIYAFAQRAALEFPVTAAYIRQFLKEAEDRDDGPDAGA